MMFLANTIVCLIVAAGDPMSPDVQVLAEGLEWEQVPAFSPDGKWVAALRWHNPARGEKEGHVEISIWNVADLQRAPERADGGERESRRNAGQSTNGVLRSPGRPPTCEITTAIQGTLTYASRTTEPEGSWFLARRKLNPTSDMVLETPGWRTKLDTEDEVKAAKAAGRRVGKFRRAVTMFLDPEDLHETSRWVHNRHLGSGNRDHTLRLVSGGKDRDPASATTESTRFLDDDVTGEEYRRLGFEKESRRDVWGLVGGGGDARTGRSRAEQQRVPDCRHGAGTGKRCGRSPPTDQLQKHAEIIHCGVGGTVMRDLTPQERPVVLSGMTASHQYGRNPKPSDLGQPDVCTIDLWQAESGRVSKSFFAHDTWAVGDLEFFPDGKRLAGLRADSPLESPATRDTDCLGCRIGRGRGSPRFQRPSQQHSVFEGWIAPLDLEPHWLRR